MKRFACSSFCHRSEGLDWRNSDISLGEVKKLGSGQLHVGEVDLSVGLVFGQGPGVVDCLDHSMEQAQSVWDSVVHFGGSGHKKSMTVLQVWLEVPWARVIHSFLHMTLADD